MYATATSGTPSQGKVGLYKSTNSITNPSFVNNITEGGGGGSTITENCYYGAPLVLVHY